MSYDFMQDKVTFHFINNDIRGEDHVCHVNGKHFVIKDNEYNTLPRAVYNHLVTRREVKFKVEGDINKGRTLKKFEYPMFLCRLVEEGEKKAAVAADPSLQEVVNEKQIKDERRRRRTVKVEDEEGEKEVSVNKRGDSIEDVILGQMEKEAAE